ncbi:hypothetical protein PVAP13_5KG149000 [Panicum virgatum]|uniref:NmrA-like domain-containing protein n=1 Tax=Panicum virgatum TaxID=38727 RepID=A0A8T0SGW9_PANVG|nr:hypothetical protein PVAP13_5KG149000 [Panicum virgatum]
MASEKSKILVVGATGDTAPSDPAKAALLKSFQDAGVTLLKGDLYDQASLVSAVKAADVVISTLGSLQLADQTRLIDAIKEAGNVKRFFPSEFGLDVDHTGIVEPGKSVLSAKVAIRRAVEAAGIPYTYVVAGFFAGYALPGIGQALAQGPPADKAVVLGDGNAKAVYVEEGDIGTYTVLAADDPRAENKTLYVRPPANTLSHNELLALWEKKSGRGFEREYVPEETVLKQIQESPVPANIILSIWHAAQVRGEQTGFEVDPAKGVEAADLYPDVKYTTVDEYLDRFL